MRKITEQTMLFRGYVELPDGLDVLTDEFLEDWKFVRSGDSNWMDKHVRDRGWHFIWIAEEQFRSGIGKTIQEATENALKLTLRHIDARFNVAEITHIEISKYPWFYLAKVRLFPYRIQPGSVLSADDTIVPRVTRQRRLPLQAMQLYPQIQKRHSLLRQSFLPMARSKEL